MADIYQTVSKGEFHPSGTLLLYNFLHIFYSKLSREKDKKYPLLEIDSSILRHPGQTYGLHPTDYIRAWGVKLSRSATDVR